MNLFPKRRSRRTHSKRWREFLLHFSGAKPLECARLQRRSLLTVLQSAVHGFKSVLQPLHSFDVYSLDWPRHENDKARTGTWKIHNGLFSGSFSCHPFTCHVPRPKSIQPRIDTDGHG